MEKFNIKVPTAEESYKHWKELESQRDTSEDNTEYDDDAQSVDDWHDDLSVDYYRSIL